MKPARRTVKEEDQLRSGLDSPEQTGLPAIVGNAMTTAMKTDRFMPNPLPAKTRGHDREYITLPFIGKHLRAPQTGAVARLSDPYPLRDGDSKPFVCREDCG